MGRIQEGHGVEGPGSPATHPGAFLFATSLELHLLVFQLAEAIQHLGMILCDGSLVALEVLSAPGLCWWVGNAVQFSTAMEASEQESCSSIQCALFYVLHDQVSGSEVKGKSSSL